MSESSTLVTVLTLIITLIVGIISPILVYISSKNGKKLKAQSEKLDKIEVHVDGRLSEALKEIKALRLLVSTSREDSKAVPERVRGGP